MTSLRRTSLDEADAVWAMKEQFLAEDGDVQKTAYEAIIELLKRSECGRVFFVCDDLLRPVGYCILCFGFSIESGGRDGFVDELFITSAHRGKGHGGVTIKLLALEAQNTGLKKLFLEVAPTNVAAQNIYKKAGFKSRTNYELMELVTDKN